MKLQHCGLVVADLEKAREFYGEYLGMPQAKRPDTFTFAGLWFRSGDTDIHIIQAADTTAPAGFAAAGKGAATGLATHFAFEVNNVEQMAERAKQFDLEIAGGPMLRGDGILQLYIYDHDRYLIELFQNTGVTDGATERAPVSNN